MKKQTAKLSVFAGAGVVVGLLVVSRILIGIPNELVATVHLPIGFAELLVYADSDLIKLPGICVVTLENAMATEYEESYKNYHCGDTTCTVVFYGRQEGDQVFQMVEYETPVLYEGRAWKGVPEEKIVVKEGKDIQTLHIHYEKLVADAAALWYFLGILAGGMAGLFVGIIILGIQERQQPSPATVSP